MSSQRFDPAQFRERLRHAMALCLSDHLEALRALERGDYELDLTGDGLNVVIPGVGAFDLVDENLWVRAEERLAAGGHGEDAASADVAEQLPRFLEEVAKHLEQRSE